MNPRALTVEDLRVQYETARGPVRAVDGVSFFVDEGERLGLVGESGSGKTTTALAILRLLRPPARIMGGSVTLCGVDLLRLNQGQLRATRLAKAALVPQGAMNSLNPVLRIREQFLDGMRTHGTGLSPGAMERRVGDLLERVGLRRDVAGLYPHELSGGMKQRVCIALAICLEPRLIVADEPTSALDVVVQRQVMETLGQVQRDLGAAVILVGHDMGLMAQFVDRIGVMYAGRLVEVGPVGQVFAEPLHPYTRLLIGSLPSLASRGQLRGIPGLAPSLLNLPSGCPFHPRCPDALPLCSQMRPELLQIEPGRWVACHVVQGVPVAA